MTKKARANGDDGGGGADVRPVDALAQRPGDRDQALEPQVVLRDRHQLRDQHVLEGHDAHRHRQHGELLAARDHVVVDRQALGPEDEVDEHVAVPRLDEPLLGRVLGAHAGVGERLQRAVDVLALDHQVEVVARLRAAARPRREAAAEQERDAGLAQRGRGLLQRRLDVGERLLVFHGHMARRTRVRAGAWPSARRTTRAVRPVTAARSGSRRPATSISAARATRSAGPRPSPACATASTSCCSPATSRRTASRSRRRWSPRRCGRSTASRSWPCSATTTGTPNRRDEVVAALEEGGGIDVLERDHRVLELCGAEVGIAGCKGFCGGFDGAHIPDFGEPLMREVYAESMREAEALDAALARDRALPVPHRAAALRADHGDAGGRAHRHLALPRHGPARRAAARAPPRPRAARARPRRARSRGGWARSRSTTSASPCWARTSGCSR